jgi:hypothetical protein
MSRIRVNTEDLKDKAKDFESAAEAFARAGDDIAAAAMAMPSYDGQLSGPARKAGYEIQSQAREMKTALTNDALYLQNAAKDFERVDNQTIDLLALNQDTLSSPTSEINLVWAPFDVGSSYLGYHDDKISDTVTLCMYGVCRKVIRKGNEELIALFESKVDRYEELRKERDKAHLILVGAYCGAAGVVIATSGAGALFAVAGAMIAYYTQWKSLHDAVEEMGRTTYEAAGYWNLLFGESLTGDDKQWPNETVGEYGDIY